MPPLDMDSFPKSFWIVFGEFPEKSLRKFKGIMIFNSPFFPANIMEYQPRAGPTGSVRRFLAEVCAVTMGACEMRRLLRRTKNAWVDETGKNAMVSMPSCGCFRK